jgi:hypothetical protein
MSSQVRRANLGLFFKISRSIAQGVAFVVRVGGCGWSGGSGLAGDGQLRCVCGNWEGRGNDQRRPSWAGIVHVARAGP